MQKYDGYNLVMTCQFQIGIKGYKKIQLDQMLSRKDTQCKGKRK